MLSYAAKKAIAGQDIVILNVSKAVVSGEKKRVVERARAKLRTRTLGSQDRGPTHPRKPETYARRALRGMLPFKKPKGKKAYRRVRIYTDVPSRYAEEPSQKVPGADASRLRCPYVLVEELSREIGGA